MDFRFSPEVEEFRARIVAFLEREMAPERTRGHSDALDLTGLDERFERALQQRAGAAGYLGATGSEQAVFDYEVAVHDAPLIDTAMTLAGYPILAFGRAAQRDMLVPAMLRGEIEMCNAYTEPGAGSDLSAITTIAEPAGDEWILTGTKTLVTGAHKADWCCTVALTRRDVPARDGMTMFVVAMDADGVIVRRRPTMNGWTLCELEFAGVRVGSDAVLGELHRGWRQLVAAVRAERTGMFHMGFARHVLTRLETYVLGATRDGRSLAADPIVRDRIAALEIEVDVGLRLAKRALWQRERDEPVAVTGAMSKVFATELLQRLALACTEIAGHHGTVYGALFDASAPPGVDPRFAWEYLERVHPTISVGANEVQRDTIAQAGLGLPRRH